MNESYYQSNIMKGIEAIGGHVVNGNYTRTGEADLQCGYPYQGILYHLCVEVKTPDNYDRVMKAVDEDYKIVDVKKLKKHEIVQMHKIAKVRRLGGLALVACSLSQVEEYVNEVLPKMPLH